MTDRLLLVMPLRACRHEGNIFIDDQAVNGLRLWLDHFDSLTLACPTEDKCPPSQFKAISDRRVSFTALPLAYKPQAFAGCLRNTIPVLRELINSSDHLHFAIGGLFGDWASVAAIMAHRMGRTFSIWTDRVESRVVAFHARTKRGPRRYYGLATAGLMERYERYVIGLSGLGLFHGMDCFTAYAPYCKNPQLVHDIHLDADDQISDADISARLLRRGPLRIAYAGRVDREKGVYDWIDTLSLLSRCGREFQATWYGSGSELDSARQMTKDAGLAGQVAFSGPTKNHGELIEKLRSFDIFLFCHKTPESPRNLVEALICGLPLVGYASPYSEDLVKQHGGGVLTPADPGALAAAIEKLPVDLAPLTRKAQLDGRQFSAEGVFRHRSELMKRFLPAASPARAAG